MNYLGAKNRLLDNVITRALRSTGLSGGVFADGYAGTHAVGAWAQRQGFGVVANDNLYVSYAVGVAKLRGHEPLLFRGLEDDIVAVDEDADQRLQVILDYLNRLLPGDWGRGWFYNAYGENGTGGRLYFSEENALRIQIIGDTIQGWNLTELEHCVLVASLVYAAARVVNTASVYYTYLKKLKATATKPLQLRVPETRNPGWKPGAVVHGDILDFVRATTADIMYLDPPYNHRQYAPNYHLLETIARWDNPVIKGVGGVRDYTNLKSAWCSKKMALPHLKAIIEANQCKFLMLSYSNEGLIETKDIIDLMMDYGNVGSHLQRLPRFKSDKNSHDRHYQPQTEVTECVYVLEKRA